MNSVYHAQLITPRPHKPEEIEKKQQSPVILDFWLENSGREIA